MKPALKPETMKGSKGEPPMSSSIKTQFISWILEAASEAPFCLLDGKRHKFPYDKCLKCKAYHYCNESWSEYLVAISKLEKLEVRG